MDHLEISRLTGYVSVTLRLVINEYMGSTLAMETLSQEFMATAPW
jgi:hypothetical protein